MPVKRGKDEKGCFFQWGSQTKYYYRCGDPTTRERARKKAERQGTMVKRKHKRKNNKRRDI